MTDHRFRQSARELWGTASGQPVPEPSDDEIAAAIRGELAPVISADRQTESAIKAALLAAARRVRGLFPSNPTTKD